MRLGFAIKHYFFSAFRELFVHHHGSLEFRAKIFALIIAANDDAMADNYIIVKNIGNEIYKNNEERADLLMLTTRELVKKVKDNNGLNIDKLIENIQRELKIVPRYAKKIDIQSLRPFVNLSFDQDTIAYQMSIMEFLQKLKDEILYNKKVQIEVDEKELTTKD